MAKEWLELTNKIDHAMADLQSVLFDIMKALPEEALAAPPFRDAETCRLEQLKQTIAGPPSGWSQADCDQDWDVAIENMTNGTVDFPNISHAHQLDDQDVTSSCGLASNEQLDQQAGSNCYASQSRSDLAAGVQLDRQASSHGHAHQSEGEIANDQQLDQRRGRECGLAEQGKSDVASAPQLDGLQAATPEPALDAISQHGHKAGGAAVATAGGGNITQTDLEKIAAAGEAQSHQLLPAEQAK